MKDCPAELLVAICSEIDQSLLQFKSFASHCSWNHLRFKFVKELCITADMAAIEQRDIELGIVAVQFAHSSKVQTGGLTRKCRSQGARRILGITCFLEVSLNGVRERNI